MPDTQYVYTPENIRKLQLVELDMLKELDRICRANRINYIIDAGTLLGAVRHGGFIPWDDDIDVRMLREDYDEFCKICEMQLDDKFFLQTYRTDKQYRWGYARILKKNTVFIRKNHEEIKSKTGIFIDIFPNDNLPASFWDYHYCTFLSWICRKALYSQVGKVHACSMIKRLGFRILDIIPKNCVYKMLESLTKKYKDEKTQKVRCFAWGSKEETLGFKREWIEDTCDIKFEDAIVRAPADSHAFLVHSFGKDYMIPPPKEKRKPGHVASYIKF